MLFIIGVLKSEQPNNSLYTYEGVIELNGKELPLTPNQLLLRVNVDLYINNQYCC